MTHRMLLRALCLAVLLGAAYAPGAGAQPERPPNVVLVVGDDLGYGSLGVYGHPFARTPHLDRFAGEGMRFTQFYAPAPNCSPSRAGLMTGRHPYRVGIYNWIPEGSPMHLRAAEVTLPELLKGEGYDTYFVGKWHLNGLFNDPAQPQPGDHGFDRWMATQNNAAPSHLDPENFVRDGAALGRLEGLSAHLVVDQAVRWLEARRDRARPFLLVVWFHEPHEPINTTEPYRQRYADREDEMEGLYYGAVSHMDEAFGRLMGALDRLGHRDDSFVVFTSDNGPAYGNPRTNPGSAGPLRAKKGHTYEGGIRVPAMVRWPGRVPAGVVSDVPLIGTDLLPTVCELVGIAPPADRVLDGQSFVRVLRGEPLVRRRPMYWQMNNAHHPHKIAMRDGDWKLLATRDFSDLELYNLEDDPGERHDLAAARPELLATLAARLQRLHDEIEAEGYKWPGLDDQGRPVGAQGGR